MYPSTVNTGQPASVIASLWRQRWLAKRIQSQNVLDKVATGNAQSLIDFFSNNARAGGMDEDDTQGDLFLRAVTGK